MNTEGKAQHCSGLICTKDIQSQHQWNTDLCYRCCQQLPQQHPSLNVTEHCFNISSLQSFLARRSKYTNSEGNFWADVAFKWQVGDNAPPPFCLACTRKEHILPVKRLGILRSGVSEIHHPWAATRSFATHRLGNNSPSIVNNSTMSHGLRDTSVLCAEGRKTSRFTTMSMLMRHHVLMSVKSKSSRIHLAFPELNQQSTYCQCMLNLLNYYLY